jgi:hypothetical protein
VTRQISKYRVFEREAPDLPDFTCNHIDDIISNLEELRNMNAELRDCTEYWKSACEEMQTEIDELTSWKKHIKAYVKEC